MITLIFGDNSFETHEAARRIIDASEVNPERIDGEKITTSQLSDIATGMSLFASKRLIIVRDLSVNKEAWSALGNLIDRIPDETRLVLLESKVDKRSAIYKILNKKAETIECKAWSEYDTKRAQDWFLQQARSRKITVDSRIASLIIERVGVDQWEIFHALEKISLLEEITEESVKKTIEDNSMGNVFNLLETAISGNIEKVQESCNKLKLNEDGYKILALLSSQTVSLLAVFYSSPGDNPARDFAINPYVVRKMEALVRRIDVTKMKRVVSIMHQADVQSKTTSAEVWLVVETALLKIASIFG